MDWKPIEGAPKDESSILLYRPKTDVHDDYDCVIQASYFQGDFYPDALQNLVDWDDRIQGATHWMPLPAPPSQYTRTTTEPFEADLTDKDYDG